MRRQIERVLKLGYTYDEVSSVLAGLDIHISGSRLKYLLGEVRKSTRSRNKKKADYVEGSEQAETDESLEPSDGDSKKNGLEKSQPVHLETQPQSQGLPKVQSQKKQPVQLENPVVSPTVEISTVDAPNDDYQPVILRKR